MRRLFAASAALPALGLALATGCATGQSRDLDMRDFEEPEGLITEQEHQQAREREQQEARELEQHYAEAAPRERDLEQPQGAQIQVEQAPPRIIVEQEQPRVQVQQQQPEVTLRQAPPRVSVEQPAPEIRVEQAPPEVSVQTPRPTVRVEQAPPEVTITQPEPRVEVRQAPPQVSLEQQGEPQVQVQVRGEPTVRMEREAEPEIEMRREAPRVLMEERDLEAEPGMQTELERLRQEIDRVDQRIEELAAEGHAEEERAVESMRRRSMQLQQDLVALETQQGEAFEDGLREREEELRALERDVSVTIRLR
jgi:hypothetical protein